jgi:hypothetical protein
VDTLPGRESCYLIASARRLIAASQIVYLAMAVNRQMAFQGSLL